MELRAVALLTLLISAAIVPTVLSGGSDLELLEGRVYSVSYDAGKVYVALGRGLAEVTLGEGIKLLDFSVGGRNVTVYGIEVRGGRLYVCGSIDGRPFYGEVVGGELKAITLNLSGALLGIKVLNSTPVALGYVVGEGRYSGLVVRGGEVLVIDCGTHCFLKDAVASGNELHLLGSIYLRRIIWRYSVLHVKLGSNGTSAEYLDLGVDTYVVSTYFRGEGVVALVRGQGFVGLLEVGNGSLKYIKLGDILWATYLPFGGVPEVLIARSAGREILFFEEGRALRVRLPPSAVLTVPAGKGLLVIATNGTAWRLSGGFRTTDYVGEVAEVGGIQVGIQEVGVPSENLILRAEVTTVKLPEVPDTGTSSEATGTGGEVPEEPRPAEGFKRDVWVPKFPDPLYLVAGAALLVTFLVLRKTIKVEET